MWRVPVAVIRPFHALRPTAELAKQVASVPYDVVNTQEARALAVVAMFARIVH